MDSLEVHRRKLKPKPVSFSKKEPDIKKQMEQEVCNEEEYEKLKTVVVSKRKDQIKASLSYYASADYISKKEEILLAKIHKMRYEELKSPDKASQHKEQFKNLKKSVT